MASEAAVQPTTKRAAHPYHMYDAIVEQPERVAQVLATQRELIESAADAAARKRLVLVGIGTSYHAAQITEHFLRHLTRGRVHALVEQAFELVHYPFALRASDAVIAVSHRGWKNYTAQALQAARAAGALTIAVTGQDCGEGMKAAHFVLPTCEQEISFAHTKSFTTALAVLAVFAIRLAERRGLQGEDAEDARAALQRVPDLMRQTLASEPIIREAAKEMSARQRLIFVGAGPNWATAREGALKVKETSYLASEGFQTEQFLHGPMAEMDPRAALVVLLTGGPGDVRSRSMLRASRELGILRVVVAAAGASEAPAEYRIEVPAAEEWLTPFVHLLVVQLLSYYVAIGRGSNPDTGREDHPQHARARIHFKL